MIVSEDVAEPQYLPLILLGKRGKGASREPRLHVVLRERAFSC